MEPKKREEYGVWVPAPKYSSGAYNNSYCGVGETEIELIESRTSRQSEICKGSATQLMNLFGTPLNEEEGTEKDREDKIIEFMDQYLILKNETKYLNLKYFSKYNGARN